MRKVIGKVADDSVQIKYLQIQIGSGSAPALDLFSCLYIITGDDISQYKKTCEVLLHFPKIEG